MALPLFFSPVRIGDRYYVDGSVAPTTEIDIALAQGAKLIIVLNPNVPIRVSALRDGVPTGHGKRSSLRDKGLMWVYNQAMRTSIHARLTQAAARVNAEGSAHVLLLEPEPDVAVRFVNNAASVQARREIMHASHRASRAKLRAWANDHAAILSAHGWKLREEAEAVEPHLGDE
jgi:predicted acylesterase/phospholipase RssA